MPGVNLALSLHSVDRETRNLLIPINQRFDLGEVIAIIDQIPLQRKQYVIFEYLLVNDVNDSEEHAAKTGEFLQGKRAIVNLIPFNPYPGALYEKPSLERVLNFQKILLQYQLPTLIRGTKGDDILAACGQLNSSKV